MKVQIRLLGTLTFVYMNERGPDKTVYICGFRSIDNVLALLNFDFLGQSFPN